MEITAPSTSAGTSPNPQASLQSAIEEFQSILTDEQRHKLRIIGTIRDAQSVMIFTAQLEHENRSAGRPGVSSRLSTVLQSVQAFSGVVGTFVSAHPEIAALVWGSVKLTMLVGKQHLKHAVFQSFHEEMQEDVRAIQQMGEEVKEEISLATARAQHEDEELQARERRAASRDRSKMWKFIPKMENDLSAMKEMHEQQLRRKAREERQRLLESLSSHEYRTPFWEACKKRQRDTAEWIFAVPEFKRWHDGSGPSLLWCSGKIGSGKTVLCANVVNHIFLHKSRHDTATFFFVNRDNADSLQAETLIRSIIRQSIDGTEVPQYVESQLINLDCAVFVQLDAWIDLLRYVVQQSTAFYILIDGLDESDAAERLAILDALSLLAATTSCLRIFLSSRESVELDLRGRSLAVSRVSMSCDSLMSDIRSYVNTSLQKRLENEELAFGDPHLLVEVNDALTQHADGIGMRQYEWSEVIHLMEISAAQGDSKAIAIFLQTRTLPSYCLHTLLRKASEGGHIKVVDQLLGAGADANTAADEYGGQTALQAACGGGHLGVVERLLSAGAVVNTAATRFSGQTALQAASGGGHLDVVKCLLSAGADVNATAVDFTGLTPLQAASKSGHIEVVDRLLLSRADVDATALDGDVLTPLQAASSGGYLQVVECLLAAGADVNATAADLKGRTALQAASGGGHLDVVNCLLSAGADVNAIAADSEGLTALQAASKSGYIKVVDRLLFCGANVDATIAELEGVTALQAASDGGHIEVVRRLLRAGACVNATAAFPLGVTALQAASNRGHIEVVKRLLHAGADVNTATSKYGGRTALQMASDRGHLKIVELLLGAGADGYDAATDALEAD
ncbi:hypothetical protein MY4824_003489 [Beauveria thailandica]